MYHKNPVIDNLVLTIIADGNGSLCGYTYEQRVEAARKGYAPSLLQSCQACRNLVKTNNANGVSAGVAPTIVKTAGELIAEYYAAHVAEMDS